MRTSDEGSPARPSHRAQIKLELGGGSATERAQIKEALARVEDVQAEVTEIDDVYMTGPSGDPDIGLFMVVLDPRDLIKWRSVLRPPGLANQPGLVVALLADKSPEPMRAALRAGADDVLSLPPTYEETVRCLLRASERQRFRQGQSEKLTCSLVSVGSGGGLAPLTVNLGFAMNRMFQKRVVLVDLDLQAAPLGVLLDLEPEHTISELADPTSVIDSIRLESVLCKHESGISMLAAPKRIEDAELVSTASVEAALKVLRDIFEVTLIDCGTHINENSVVAWEHSEWLFYVVEQSVTGVRAAQRFLTLFERLGLRDGHPSLLLNRYDPSNPITPEQIEAALQIPIFAKVPRDDYAFNQMQMTGKNAWRISSSSGVRSSFESIARRMVAAAEAREERKPGLFSRLLSSLGF